MISNDDFKIEYPSRKPRTTEPDIEADKADLFDAPIGADEVYNVPAE